MTECSPLTISASRSGGACLLAPAGLLDSTTYLSVRDSIVKAARRAQRRDHRGNPTRRANGFGLGGVHQCVLARWAGRTCRLCWSVSGLPAGTPSSVTASADISRYTTVASAPAALLRSDLPPVRERARMPLPAQPSSAAQARRLAAMWLTTWGMQKYLPTVHTVVTVFVENVLAHTDSAPVLRIESAGELVTVAVEDAGTVPAARHERSDDIAPVVSGLSVVAALNPRWGNVPTSTGKTGWAVIGPENCI